MLCCVLQMNLILWDYLKGDVEALNTSNDVCELLSWFRECRVGCGLVRLDPVGADRILQLSLPDAADWKVNAQGLPRLLEVRFQLRLCMFPSA